MAWSTLATVSSKIFTWIGQIVLAWLLIPEDFGVVGLAYTVFSFVLLLKQVGLRQILVQRQTQMHRWANPAFWMGLTAGCLAALVMIGVAPLGALVYREPRLTGLILVLAGSIPLSALSDVPYAKLQTEMRFGAIAVIGSFTAVGKTVLTILLAWLGFGPYSFVLPVPIVAGGSALAFWPVARPRIRWRPQFRRWRFLVADSAALFVVAVCGTLVSQGDYMVLGIFHDTEAVGLYFFAFSLSMQTIQLFTMELSNVLFSALSQLHNEPLRQTQAFLRAARYLALVAMPLGLLQAALADPLIRALFSPKWYAAIPLVQLLSIAMTPRLVGMQGGSLIMAQGRFATLSRLLLVYAIDFMLLVTLGAWLGGVTAVAVAAMVHYSLEGPINLCIAIRPGQGRWADVWGVYRMPLLVGGVSILTGVLLAQIITGTMSQPYQPWIEAITITAVGVGLYVGIIRWIAPGVWGELVGSFLRALPRG